MKSTTGTDTQASQEAGNRPPQKPIYLENTQEIRRRVAVYYLIHPGARIVVRVVTLAIAGLVAFILLVRAGYLKPSYAPSLYYAILAALEVVLAMVSILGVRGRFTGLIPQPDPGHWNLPYLPPGTDIAKGFREVRLPAERVPGTYPADAPADAVRRVGLEWTYPPGQTASMRAIQLKFGAIAVHAAGRDAKEARAYARVRVNHGVGGSLSTKGWSPIGQLNWYTEEWQDRLSSDERSPDGGVSQPLLDYAYEHPAIGFNKYLHNPEVTILRDQACHLPLFYMREGWPEVFLCGRSQALTVGKSPDEAPVDFDMELTVGALDFRIRKLKLHCTSKWDVLTVEPGKW